jgi:phospholipase A1
MKKMHRQAAGLLLSIILVLGVIPGSGASDAKLNRCVAERLATAGDEITVGRLRADCRAFLEAYAKDGSGEQATLASEDDSAIDQRLADEDAVESNAFGIVPHKPNYLIASYNFLDPNVAPFREAYPDSNANLDDAELKFQISFKFPIVRNIFGDNGDLYFAYTNRSFWQVFNDDLSSPFRDYNHEPEAWIAFDNDWEFFGLKNRLFSIGAVHQSNGQAGVLSRSWNRIFANFIFEKENFYFSIKPWIRISESEDEDDNPDITDYMGNFEFQGVYKYRKQNFGLMVRNNLRTSHNRGAFQLDWSFPLHEQLRGYVQWFYGYGESLLDYNHKVNAVGVGVKLTDWL